MRLNKLESACNIILLLKLKWDKPYRVQKRWDGRGQASELTMVPIEFLEYTLAAYRRLCLPVRVKYRGANRRRGPGPWQSLWGSVCLKENATHFSIYLK